MRPIDVFVGRDHIFVLKFGDEGLVIMRDSEVAYQGMNMQQARLYMKGIRILYA